MTLIFPTQWTPVAEGLPKMFPFECIDQSDVLEIKTDKGEIHVGYYYECWEPNEDKPSLKEWAYFDGDEYKGLDSDMKGELGQVTHWRNPIPMHAAKAE